MENKALEDKIRELRQLKRMAEELNQEITTAEDMIKKEMTQRGVDQIITSEYKVTWKSVVSQRLDTKALKNELPELYDRFAHPSVTWRFVVT